MGGLICWMVAIVGTAAALAAVYFFATFGGELALKREREEHLRIVNAARRRNGQPPLTEADLTLETQADREAAAERQRLKDMVMGGLGMRKGPGFEVEEISEEDIPMAQVVKPPPVPQTATKEEGETTHSIVLLEAEYRELDRAKLQRLTEKAWGVIFPEQTPDTTEFVMETGPGMPFLISAGGWHFMVHNTPASYFNNPEELSEKIRELRTSKAIAEGRAFRMVDLLGGDSEQNPQQKHAYALMGKLAAQLAGNTTLGIVLPKFDNRFFPYNEHTLRALLSEDVVEELKGVRTDLVHMVEDDQKMIDAMTEARRRFHEFEEEFASRLVIKGQKNPFIVKAPFTDGTHTEYMWVEVLELTGGKIRGHLMSTPVEVKDLVQDEEVTVPVGLISDWLMVRNGEPVGNFTGQVIAAQQQHGA